MSNYRRWFQQGGTYFFTVVTYSRRELFRDPDARSLLGSVMREVQRERPVTTVAIVLLYDHIHTVWQLPAGDDDFSTRWKLIKRRFTERWIARGGVEGEVTGSQAARGNRGIWQKRFWEHLIRDEEDLEAHCDYIHYNAVKHRYVRSPNDWPYSSFHRFVKLGHYSNDWGRQEPRSISGLDFE